MYPTEALGDMYPFLFTIGIIGCMDTGRPYTVLREVQMQRAGELRVQTWGLFRSCLR